MGLEHPDPGSKPLSELRSAGIQAHLSINISFPVRYWIRKPKTQVFLLLLTPIFLCLLQTPSSCSQDQPSWGGDVMRNSFQAQQWQSCPLQRKGKPKPHLFPHFLWKDFTGPHCKGAWIKLSVNEEILPWSISKVTSAKCEVFKDSHLSNCSETWFLLALCGPGWSLWSVQEESFLQSTQSSFRPFLSPNTSCVRGTYLSRDWVL